MKWLIPWLLVILCGPAWALSDVRGAADYPALKRFPFSSIVDYDQGPAVDYRLILGGLEKVNGVIIPERELRLQGTLTRITYRIPDTHSAEASFSHFSEQLKQSGAELLFECQGRACGSSNHWANDVFSYFRLYGPDSGQFYSAFKWNGSHAAVYSITRGNRRVYTRLEILEAENGRQDIADQFPASGWMRLDSPENLSRLVEYLQHSTEPVWLVATDFSAGTRSEQLDASGQALDSMQQRLIEMGAAEELIRLYPLGSFAGGKEAGSSQGIIVYTDAYQGQGKQ